MSIAKVAAALCGASAVLIAGCSKSQDQGAPSQANPDGSTATSSVAASSSAANPTSQVPNGSKPAHKTYRWHRRIVATTFWVGEIFDPNAADGSQMISTYDSRWYAHYGGCDGVKTAHGCETERRTAANGYFPTKMKPRQNPFYLDLPFDDVNDAKAFSERGRVVPWAHSVRYASSIKNPSRSLMKNRWVELTRGGRTCYGQIEDAGPGTYHDAAYVFGNARPANKRYGGAGLDVSPALNGCLAFSELDGDTDRVNWRFVDTGSVPSGPWKKVVTTQGVME
jgi:hypothetical protein